MTQIYWIYTQPNGEVAVLASAHLEQLAKEGWDTPDKVRALVISKVTAQGATNIVEMPPGWLPPEDRLFRNAWRRKGECVEPSSFTNELDIEMPVARELHREKIRRRRIAALEALDVEYQKADEKNDQNKKREIAAKKQALRDAPADPAIDAAKTVEDLKKIYPELAYYRLDKRLTG